MTSLNEYLAGLQKKYKVHAVPTEFVLKLFIKELRACIDQDPSDLSSKELEAKLARLRFLGSAIKAYKDKHHPRTGQAREL